MSLPHGLRVFPSQEELDRINAASAQPGTWQLRTSTITLVLLLIGAAFGSGIAGTEYRGIAWIAFLAFTILVATRMSGFDEALEAEKRAHDLTARALSEAGRQLNEQAEELSAARAQLERYERDAEDTPTRVYAATWATEALEV
jgi:uncharacterized membrane protein YtjA (UPF0391 family)